MFYGSNKELAAEDTIVVCPKCSSAQLRKSKGIEVGHTFLLGDKYSKIFGAKFMQVKLAYFKSSKLQDHPAQVGRK